MINFALLPAPQNELNPFTTEIKRRFLETGKPVLVEMRDGTIVKVGYMPITEGNNDEELFFGNDWQYCFSANGQAMNSKQCDLIKLVEP